MGLGRSIVEEEDMHRELRQWQVLYSILGGAKGDVMKLAIIGECVCVWFLFFLGEIEGQFANAKAHEAIDHLAIK